MTSADLASQDRRIGILGGGFGLYGYLPAAVQHGATCVLLPERSRARFLLRPELQRFSTTIRWLPEDVLMREADTLIVARRPVDNASAVDAWTSLDARDASPARMLVLEKPLAVTPADARHLLDVVAAHRIHLKAGFTFRWTSWAERWGSLLHAHTGSWHLRWSFFAHHYAHELANWKRLHAAGGGALRFFGIHIVALLAEWGYDDVVSSALEQEPDGGAPRWRARFRGPSLREVTVDVQTRAQQPLFDVRGDDGAIVHAGRDPFDAPLPEMRWPDVDRRCSLLAALLDEDPPSAAAARIAAATQLWARIEDATTFIARIEDEPSCA